MSSLDRPAFNNIRSGGRGGMNPWMMQQMEQSGMQPIYGPQGGVREMAYSMKAPPSPLDTTRNLTGITGEFGSKEHTNSWNDFFKNYAQGSQRPAQMQPPPPAGNADIADDESFGGGGTPTSYGTSFVGGVPSPQTHIGASIAQNSQWLGQNGIAFPPPPTNLFPGDSGNASLAKTAAYQPQNPAPLTGPMGSAGTDAANLAQNKSLYAPGGWKAKTSQSNWPSGWTSTSPTQTASIASQYQPDQTAMNNWLKARPING